MPISPCTFFSFCLVVGSRGLARQQQVYRFVLGRYGGMNRDKTGAEFFSIASPSNNAV
ncbi:hypothetical protein ACFS07_22740 [Undibacterium arcticum]